MEVITAEHATGALHFLDKLLQQRRAVRGLEMTGRRHAGAPRETPTESLCDFAVCRNAPQLLDDERVQRNH